MKKTKKKEKKKKMADAGMENGKPQIVHWSATSYRVWPINVQEIETKSQQWRPVWPRFLSATNQTGKKVEMEDDGDPNPIKWKCHKTLHNGGCVSRNLIAKSIANLSIDRKSSIYLSQIYRKPIYRKIY